MRLKRDVVYEYQVNGRPILSPDRDIEVTLTDIYSADSGMDESGVAHHVLIRPNSHTWVIRYSFLTEEEFLYMTGLFQGRVASLLAMTKHHDQGMSNFTFTYWDRQYTDSDYRSCVAYCQNVTYTHRSRGGLYINVSFKICER